MNGRWVGVLVPETYGSSEDNRATMDRIARPFSASRSRPWVPVTDFLDGLPAGSRVLDLAGGNGRHAEAARVRGHDVVLSDISSALLLEGPDVGRVQGDMLRVPFRPRSFNAVLCIAGIHCVQGRARRVAALASMRELLVDDGRALISVWARGQPRLDKKARPLAEADGYEDGDVIVPWGKDVDEPVDRFFHLYAEDEIVGEVEAAGWIVESVEGHELTGQGVVDNHFVVARRT